MLTFTFIYFLHKKCLNNIDKYILLLLYYYYYYYYYIIIIIIIILLLLLKEVGNARRDWMKQYQSGDPRSRKEEKWKTGENKKGASCLG